MPDAARVILNNPGSFLPSYVSDINTFANFSTMGSGKIFLLDYMRNKMLILINRKNWMKNVHRMSFKSYYILHLCANRAKHLIFQAGCMLDAGKVKNQIGLPSGTKARQVLR